jgi:hypothetical protein
MHNDDTSMRVLMLRRDPSDERTGVFTSGIESVGEDRKIALYFTGSRHAGENLAEVLMQRSANSFDYLIELQRHAQELAACPAKWMPWNYRETLSRTVNLPDPA